MRLERLEIAGFKSFSDRSELAFDRGVTAIVGPNGCGKSNVADAITWVLGEQSARSLRGEKMEDVIFSGSDARKPTGTAEVRLRLSGVTVLPSATIPLELAKANGNGNGHGNGHDVAAPTPAEDVLDEFRPAGRDVELIRRLYRSGESEYLIDGEHCRLKDIHELLMDTGLGAKAYAIIEQGKIGLILSSRPTDRRQLIEEAAGITKYKARRRSAELKLEAAQQNLTRVDDIVFEVEKQRGSLKRQAAKARRHQRLYDELRRWEKVLFARKYRDLAQSIDDARRKLGDVRERESIAAAAVAEHDNTLGALRIEVAEHDTQVTATRERSHAHELEIRRTEQQIELNRQQIDVLGTRMTELAQELETLSARREPQRLELEERRDRAARGEQELTQAESSLASANDAYVLASREIEGLEGDVENARREVYGALSHATTLRHAIDNAAAAGERVRDDLSRLDVEETDLRVESERLAEGRVGAERSLADARESLARARNERAQLDVVLGEARAQQARLAQELRSREHDLAGLVARLASLEELEAARTGFTEGARLVLAEANGSVEQHGAVADWLEVDRRYERSAEALLGDLLQHVIVPTHQHAANGLALLRARDAGRCGFVVADEEAATPETMPALEGAIALDALIRPTGPYAAAVRAVVPRAYVADSLDAAIVAARATGADVATPDGDVVRGRFVVVGGGRHDARGILATKNEIRELRVRIDEGHELVASTAAAFSSASDSVTATIAAIEQRSAELHELEKGIVGVDAQLARLADEAGRLERKGELLTSERRRANEEAARHDARRAEAQQSVTELETRQRELDSAFSGTQQRLADARGRVESLAARVAEAKAAHAALIERRTALAAEVLRLEEASREMEMRLAALAAERAQKSDRRSALEVETAEALARFDAAVIELDAIKADVHAAETAAGVLRGKVDAEERSVRDARAVLDAFRGEASALEIARATAESDLAHLGSTCFETVQATLDVVVAEVDELERAGAATPDTRALAVDEGIEDEERAAGDAVDVDPFGRPVEIDSLTAVTDDVMAAAPLRVDTVRTITAEEAIAGLRTKIDRLGPVNMMAIEQFDELEVRHQFLTTQRKDLVDSIAATNEAIKRIDETSKVRFREAFEAINRNFQQTFSTLFGGGHAGITLIDETDPLESGIDIVASPPGKRLQNVQLLSGGEKALTAISLMFAIFKFKPSPFCLLDEIDAPLDDANIGRFVEMLKGMLHHTQFILITHNRKTMEIADRLYGVTMEEPGVSKLISVRLN
jgi:chromosome segregation protein